MASSKSVVIAALIANGAIAILKFFGFLLTASPSMLSETFHSISDTGNQVFLLIGIRFSERDPNRKHPFGYGKAQFFYAFVVSMLLFGIAGWESAKHGYNEVRAVLFDAGGHGAEAGHGAVEFLGFTLGVNLPFPEVYVNYGVLIGAIAFESYALWKANQGLTAEIRQNDWSGYREAFRKTADVTTLTAFTEDTIALVGAAIALVGVFLTEQTGMEIFDAAAALLIGFLLMFFALALAWENKRLILGESLPAPQERELRNIVRDWEGVEEVVDLRTVYFGADRVVLSADLVFRGGMETAEIDESITDLERTLKEAAPELSKVYIEPEVRTDL